MFIVNKEFMKEELRALIKDLLNISITKDEDPIGIDSIDFLDLVIRIEDAYAIHIDLESLDRNISLENLSILVESIVQDKTN